MKNTKTNVGDANPLFLVTSYQCCWKCSNQAQVIALATYRYIDLESGDVEDSTDEGQPFVLTSIVKMPIAIFAHVKKFHPFYRRHFSRTAEQEYYANLCSCGANFGDFYLHSEPEGAFCPIDETQAKQMTITKLPFEGVYKFKCGWSLGAWDLIAAHAAKINM